MKTFVKTLLSILSLFIMTPLAFANSNRGQLTGLCQNQAPFITGGWSSGGQLAINQGASMPGCTITVTNAFTGATPTLYSDQTGGGGVGTVLANPFTVSASATTWTFFVDDGTYTINVSGTYTTGLGTVVTANATMSNIVVANQNSTAQTDGVLFIPETACFGATTGTAGSGNATDILVGSGGVRVYRVSATNASSSANTFTCNFQLPSRLTAGKGATITDITAVVSTQSTQPTSITLPTLKTFTAPAAVDPETANSATFVTAGGTITQTPTSAQFAVYSAVAAGQFYTVKAALGTPLLVNSDLQTLQYVIVFNQSASAASLQELAGLYVHYKYGAL